MFKKPDIVHYDVHSFIFSDCFSCL